MDTKTFWQEAGRLIDEYSLANHPIVTLIRDGKATRDQLGRYAIEHYELTIRDAGRYLSQGYLSMVEIDEQGADMVAENFAEETCGLLSHSAGHPKLMFDYWEKGLGFARHELLEASASPASRMFNACMWRIVTLKPRFIGAGGMVEAIELPSHLQLLEGVEKHYGFAPEASRFFSVHAEADKQHYETGKQLVERLVHTDRERQEFLIEARILLDLFKRGFDAMV
jgi:pyrroloquinoline quinone (PQQ) biosynthesis protein C